LKVKAKVTLFEGGATYPPGAIFEVDEKRAKALGDSVEILKEPEKKEPEKKEIKEAPRDKMMEKAKTK